MQRRTAYVLLGSLALCRGVVAQTDGLVCIARDSLATIEVETSALRVQVHGEVLFVEDGSSIRLIDVSDPRSPTPLGGWLALDDVEDFEVVGTTMYASVAHNGLFVVDIANMASPTTLGSCEEVYQPNGVAVSGHHVYVGNGAYGVATVDVLDPSAPVLVANSIPGGYVGEVLVHGSTLLANDSVAGLVLLDARDPASLTPLASVPSLNPKDMSVFDDVLFAVDPSDDVLLAIGISDPANPVLLGSFYISDGAEAFAYYNQHGYVVTKTSALQIFDVSSPSAPAHIGEYELPEVPYHASAAVADSVAFVTLEDGGIQVIDVTFPKHSPILGHKGSLLANDVEIAGRLAYVAGGTNGLWVFDIVDPTSPVRINTFPSAGYSRGVAIDGSYVYLADGSAGLRVIDVHDPGHMQLVGEVDTPGEAWHVVIQDRIAYVADRSGGLKIIDVSDPAHPNPIGHLGGFSDARDIVVQGNHGYLVNRGTGLHILDLSDPTAPVVIGHLVASRASEVHVENGRAFLASASAFLVADVNDPTDPFELSRAPTTIARCVEVSGDRAFVGDFDRMRVYDISDAFNPTPLVETRVSPYSLQGSPTAIVVRGGVAYAAMQPGLWLVDVSEDCGPCRTDFNQSNSLDFLDVELFLAAFADRDSKADFLLDGFIDFFDVQEFLREFSAGCP